MFILRIRIYFDHIFSSEKNVLLKFTGDVERSGIRETRFLQISISSVVRDWYVNLPGKASDH